MFKRIILFSVFLFFLVPVYGQDSIASSDPVLKNTVGNKVNKNEVVEFRHTSKILEREMSYRVIFPADYKNNKDRRYPVIYLLHGLFGSFKDWSDRTKLSEYSTEFEYIFVMPDGSNGWYTNSATIAKDKYESYLIQELIPEIDKNYRTKVSKESRAIAGLSMGGYGSLKFGLKYPEMFALAGSFSGALGITDVTDKNSPEWISNSVMKIYGDSQNETRINNDIFRLIRETPTEKVKNLPFIYFDCGTEDFLVQNNRDFLRLLQEKKIPHEYRELPGIHDWNFWDSQVQEFIELTEKYIK